MGAKYLLLLALILLLITFTSPLPVLAGPKSTNYELKAYGFGAGGVDNGQSANYRMNGAAGEVDQGQSSSTNYKSGNGLSYTMLANTPAAPTLGNGSGTYYNKLTCTLDTGNNPSSAEFLINISTDGFVTDTTHYVQADHTISTSKVWQTNSSWGASGFTIINLTPGTTYSVRVSARAGNFTQSPYSATATKATVNPTLSFSFNPNTINNWTLSTSVTSSSTVTVNLDTNATSGGSIYIYDSNSGLTSLSPSHTISSVTNDLTSLNEGYGAQDASLSQASGGPMEKVSPYNGITSNVGVLNTSEQVLFDSSSQPVTTGQATFNLKAKVQTSTPASSNYTDTITLVAAGDF